MIKVKKTPPTQPPSPQICFCFITPPNLLQFNDSLSLMFFLSDFWSSYDPHFSSSSYFNKYLLTIGDPLSTCAYVNASNVI